MRGSAGPAGAGRLPRRTRRIAATVVLALLAALAGPGAATPADAGVPRLRAPSKTFLRKPGYKAAAYPPRVAARSTVAGFPALFNDGRGRVWLSYSQHADRPTARPRFATLVSTDQGRTFRRHAAAVDVTNATRLPDGRTVAVAGNASMVGGRARRDLATMPVWRGVAGRTAWARTTGTLRLRTPAVPTGGVILNHGIVRDRGVLVAPYYGRIVGDPAGPYSTRTEVAVSADGVTWSTRGTVARPYRVGGGEIVVYNEASLVRLGSGALMAVMRRERMRPDGSRRRALPLVYALSRDGGRTWGRPAAVRLGGRAVTRGARPMVYRMPNGGYLLAAGRPDSVVLFARRVHRDGSPRWTGSTLIHRNYPTKRSRGTVRRLNGSSGYVAMAPLGNATMLTAVDNCAPTWGCPANLGGWVTDRGGRIIVRNVAIVPR